MILKEGTVIETDMNKLYQHIIIINIRFSILQILLYIGIKFTKKDYYYYEYILYNSMNFLYVKNTMKKSLMKLIYKSLIKVLKSKNGRFRSNILGKRNDYSGRSVIIADSNLVIHICILPYKITKILYQPIIINFFIKYGIKNYIRFKIRKFITKIKKEIWPIISPIFNKFIVILNRAPTLHRIGFQAFISLIIRKYSIFLNSLICLSFNADFDGDQMAVHISLVMSSKYEVFRLIIPESYFFFISIKNVVFILRQDIVISLYLLIIINYIFFYYNRLWKISVFLIYYEFRKNNIFSDSKDIFQKFENKIVIFYQVIWLYI